jgi:hypothetical protein
MGGGISSNRADGSRPVYIIINQLGFSLFTVIFETNPTRSSRSLVPELPGSYLKWKWIPIICVPTDIRPDGHGFGCIHWRGYGQYIKSAGSSETDMRKPYLTPFAC